MTPPHAQLVLASASPRRRQLLGYLGVEFTSISTQGEDEDRALPPPLVADLPPFPQASGLHPTLLAWRKCDAAAEMTNGLLLGADTVVVVDGQVLGKPRDPAHAEQMLQVLAGRTHTVYTGVALLNTETGATQLALDAADVTMAAINAATIKAYVATGEPLDKAGAYGIQGLGGQLVTQVQGSFSCVIGLPLGVVYRLLQTAGYPALVKPEVAFQRWHAEHGKDGPPCTAP
ncbi:MAG: septum formation protein Maf [Herpetosiphonaceae bacterium]|nr:septum formation protein Maf [Herpetosiphonaceae bacterium]